ncbi:Uma2 family endonuclease [Limnothrix sp. FACHB-708]|uniref:Uma2 family endonuclease n=1 Tax=unclassified Limnothrix TaxID=2632864 RepID=UPI001689F93B|nr:MULTISPECIES: Uma2 family endonuclease [unclassified Limnothrix]MBD2552133.1 Uma2 family endonuclease [Limnothrix sp. FACHB-708]MBD2592347.1 Uma2 family endonuclease [Limnothrix sp. FACHB-406]
MVEASTTTARHIACVNRLMHLLTARLQEQVIVSVHNSLQMTDSFPQPDIAVLRWRSNFYEDGYPTPADVQLLIEVADSTARYDRQVKGVLYARESIGDYWLVDLEQRHLEVYRSPCADGYGDRLILQPGETIAPIAFPDRIIAVEQCFAALSSP